MLPVRWRAIIGLVSASAIAALILIPRVDVWDGPILDATGVVALILVVVTAYYAVQNAKMAHAMQAQLDVSRATDVARQREVHLLHNPLLEAGPLSTSNAASKLATDVENQSDQPALGVSVTVWATRSVPLIGAQIPAGAEKVTVQHPVAIRGRQKVVIELDGTSLRQMPLSPDHFFWADPIYVDLRWTGPLGQRSLSRYERRRSQPYWRLRLVRIEPDVLGASPIDVEF